MAIRNKQAFVTFGALADIIAPLSQGGVWITGNDFGTNPKATLEKLFPGTTWQDSRTTVNCVDKVESDGWFFFKNASNPNQTARPISTASSAGASNISLVNGTFTETVPLAYSSGIKITGTYNLFIYKRLS